MERLNRRQAALLFFLLNRQEFHTSRWLGEHFQVTSRTIRNDADRIAEMLEELNLDAELIRKPSEGLQLQASIKTAQIIKMALNPYAEQLDDTLKDILFHLASQTTFIQIQDIMDQYYVSRSKAVQLLDTLENWLNTYNLKLERRKHKGFRLDGDEWQLRRAMKDLSFEENPPHFEYDFQLVFQEFKKMEQRLQFPLTDRARNNLLYHTLIFIQRLRLGNVIEEKTGKNRYSLHRHPEYKLACEFVKRLSEVFQIRIPSQEAEYFALHLLGSKRERMNEQETMDHWNLLDDEAVDMMETFITAVASDFSPDMAHDDDFKRALVLHFQTTLHRLRYHLRVENPMLHETKVEYKSSFDWVKHWVQTVDEPLLQKVPEDEIGFLAIHLQSAIERHRRMNEPVHKVLIVCETGMGTAYLIKEKFNNLFPGIRETEVSAVNEWERKRNSFRPDLILSTVDIDDDRVFQVSPVFSKEDQQALIRWMDHTEKEMPVIVRYSRPPLFFPDMKVETKEQAIGYLADALIERGFASPTMKKHALERENLGTTAISSDISIPHGRTEDILHSAIAAAILKHPVDWGGEDVSLVFFIAVDYASPGEAETLFKELFQLSRQEALVTDLKQAETYQEFKTLIKRNEEVS
ncbi:BglG family transcription antiterminator [Salibacterium sp. K-3]